MRHIAIFFLVSVASCSFGQELLLRHRKMFDTELKPWVRTFTGFNLADLRPLDTLPFESNYPQDLDQYDSFLLTYKPVVTFSADSSSFIDIYSYQLNLEKKGDQYYATPEIDQAVLLFDKGKGYWNRIYFGTSTQWIEEVVWTSDTTFILAGVTKAGRGRNAPMILIGDTETQMLLRYVAEKGSFQNDAGYLSPKLRRISIKGL